MLGVGEPWEGGVMADGPWWTQSPLLEKHIA